MIDHTGVGVTNLDRSKAFYRAALAPLGYALIMEWEQSAGFGVPPKPDFWIGEGESNARRSTSPFAPQTRQQVDAFYRAALAAGGRDNGAPGPRPHYHADYYGAFVLDPDGHNIEAVSRPA